MIILCCLNLLDHEIENQLYLFEFQQKKALTLASLWLL